MSDLKTLKTILSLETLAGRAKHKKDYVLAAEHALYEGYLTASQEALKAALPANQYSELIRSAPTSNQLATYLKENQ